MDPLTNPSGQPVLRVFAPHAERYTVYLCTPVVNGPIRSQAGIKRLALSGNSVYNSYTSQNHQYFLHNRDPFF